jgi:RNA polymerase-binding transcription factor DksA
MPRNALADARRGFCVEHNARLVKSMKANQLVTKTRAAGKGVEASPDHATTAAILCPAFGSVSKGKPRQIPPKWAKHYRRLLTLRAHLEAERGSHAVVASQPLEPYSMDMADAATDEFDRDVALCKLSAEQDALYEIDEALKRIEQGTYGVCELSGKRIPQARLRALPWTRFAWDVKRQLELAGAIPRPHLGELRSVTGAATGRLGKAEAGEEQPEPPPSDESLSRVVPTPGSDLSARERIRPVKKPSSTRPLPAADHQAKYQSHHGR